MHQVSVGQVGDELQGRNIFDQRQTVWCRNEDVKDVIVGIIKRKDIG